MDALEVPVEDVAPLVVESAFVEGEATVVVRCHGAVTLAMLWENASGGCLVEVGQGDDLNSATGAWNEHPKLLVVLDGAAGGGDAALAATVGIDAAHVHDGIDVGGAGITGAHALVAARMVGTVDGVEVRELLIFVVGNPENLTVFAEVGVAVVVGAHHFEVVAL